MLTILSEIMEKRGINANELAKVSGVPKSTVYNLVKGEVDPSKIYVDHIVKIAKALDVTVEELYGHKIPEPTPQRMSLTDDERELLAAWRRASDAARESVLMVLKCNPAPVVKKDVAI